MSETIVGILGFLTIVAIVYMLFQSKTLPSIAFIVFPTILGVILVAGGYYTFPNLGALVKAGFASTGPTAALFVFSVLYFSIMNDEAAKKLRQLGGEFTPESRRRLAAFLASRGYTPSEIAHLVDSDVPFEQ